MSALLSTELISVCLCFAAWAKVEVTMHESVEVYLGDSAQIPCQYSFTDTDSQPSFVMIQWFVVSAAGPAALCFTHSHTNQICQNAENNEI